MNDYDRDEQLGENDCHSGIPAREGMSDHYYKGYGLVYECDAIHSNTMTKFNEMFPCL